MSDRRLEGRRMRRRMRKRRRPQPRQLPQLGPRALHFTPDCRGTELQRGMARAQGNLMHGEEGLDSVQKLLDKLAS